VCAGRATASSRAATSKAEDRPVDSRLATVWNALLYTAFAGAILLAGRSTAAPLPGEALKFQQLPLTGGSAGGGAGAPFPGHAETSTAYRTFDPVTQEPTGWEGTFMADDFADTVSSPVVSLRWWGSYAGDVTGDGGVRHFLISFETDVPGGAAGASQPGTPLVTTIVTRGPLAPSSGTFVEHSVPSTGSGQLYEYEAELVLGKEFAQQPDTVYWLKIVALVDSTQDGAISWGWHDRDWSLPDPLASGPPLVVPGEGVTGTTASGDDVHHFQDAAVAGSISITPGLDVQQSGFVPQRYLDGIDGPAGLEQFGKDLAFELFTPVPEPGTAILVALGAAVLGVARERRPRRSLGVRSS
jgi:hypothetical protein